MAPPVVLKSTVPPTARWIAPRASVSPATVLLTVEAPELTLKPPKACVAFAAGLA